MKEITEDKGRVRPVVEGDFQCDENGNSTRVYEILSIVGIVDSVGKLSYISKKNVPIGIPITDEEYWYPFQVIAVPKGDKGDDGKSAYDLYIEHGGTIAPVEEWLESLHGADGKDAISPILRISPDGSSIEISSDNGQTWLLFQKDFNKLRVLGYVESVAQLPVSANIGDIYGVWNQQAQSGAGAYELYINTVKDWTLEYTITKVYDYDTELPSSAADGTTVLVPVTDLTLDKEKVDGYKVYRFSLADNGWVMILNTAEIYASKEDIVSHGDNKYALVQGEGSLTETKLRENTVVSKKDYCRIVNMTDNSLMLIIVQDSKRMFHSIGTGAYMLPNNCGVYLVNDSSVTDDIVIAPSMHVSEATHLSDLEYMPEGIYPYYILTESSVGDIYITPESKLTPNESEEQEGLTVETKTTTLLSFKQTYELYKRVVDWVYFGTNASITYHLVQNVQEGSATNILSGKATKDAINAEITRATNAEQHLDDIKVDKEEGKGLIPLQYIQEVENPEFIRVYLDANDRILWGIQHDGNIYYGAGCPQQVKDYIQEQIDEIMGAHDVTEAIDSVKEIIAFLETFTHDETLAEVLNEMREDYDGKITAEKERAQNAEATLNNSKQDKEEGRGLIDTNVAEGIHYVENPEFVTVVIDANQKILYGVKTDGDFFFGAGVPQQVIDYVLANKDIIDADILAEKARAMAVEDTKVDKVEGKGLSTNDYDNAAKELVDMNNLTDNPEFVRVWLDADKKILLGIQSDGNILFGAGVPNQVVNYINEKIAELSLDEYEDIVAFLDGIINKQPIFTNKKVSIIGDSISTFAGYIPDGYPSWYPHENDRSSDVVSINDTWWKKLIDATNSTLVVNASASGSTASSNYIGFSPRVSMLGTPDVILVALGTNDSRLSVPIGNIDFDEDTYDLNQFAPAYIKGIKDTMSKYPYARIICLAFDMGTTYQNTIKTIAEHYGIEYIYVGDISDVHPNKAEMQAVYEKIYNTYTLSGLLATKVDKEDGKSLIDSEFAGGISYVENPEFTAVYLDKDERILFGVQTDGNFLFGCGVPSQVKDYIEQKIEKLPLESIVNFIGEYLNNTTLEELLSKKVDGEYVENPEFIETKVDAEDKVLEGIQQDGTKVIGGDVKVLGSIDINRVTYKVVSNPEWLKVVLDEEDRIICGIKADGRFVVYIADFLDDIEAIKARLEELDAYSVTENPEFMEIELDADDKILGGRKVDGTKFENVGLDFGCAVLKGVDDPEDRIEVKTDSDEKIISYRKKDGTLVENAGIETPSLKVTKSIELVGDAEKNIVSDIKASLNMPYMTKKFNLPDYGSIDVICELFYLGTDNKKYNPTEVTKVNNIWYVTATLTESVDPVTGEISYEVNENSIATTYTEIDVDMEDTTLWPVDKTKHYCKVAMKFGDIDGTWYATVAFQGASTLAKPKRGLRITTYKKSDFAKKDKIRIGEMISTSKFNVKAYYEDPTRLRDIVLQRLVIEARNLRDYSEQYPWNNDYPIFTGAVGTIQSFPVKLTTSGNFYGVSMMGLAKDKANFMLDGDADGMIISGDIESVGGVIHTCSFAEFDPLAWTDEMNDEEDLTDHHQTPSNYAALTTFFDWIQNGEWTKSDVAQHLSVIDWIDYYIFVQVFRMRDNDVHNLILYTKADKVKFYAFLYDLDLSWGRGYNYDMPIDNESLILWKKFVTLYWDEIVERYTYLRSTVLNYNHVSNLINSIQASIKYSDFEDEMEKWNEINYTNATKNMLNNFKSCLEHFDNFFIN